MTEYDPLSAGEVLRWRSSFEPPLGVYEVLGQFVGLDRVNAALCLLWPTFREVRGCVLLPWVFDAASFDEWWASTRGDVRRIEAALNHLHLWDVFPDADSSPDALRYAGERLAASWSAALASQFPERDFLVRFTDDEEDYGPTVSVSSPAGTGDPRNPQGLPTDV